MEGDLGDIGRVFGGAEDDGHAHDVVGAGPDRGAGHEEEAAHHQSGAGEQDEGQGHLDCNQEPGEPAPAPSKAGAPAAVFERLHHLGFGKPQRGREAEQDAGQEGDRGQVAEDLEIHAEGEMRRPVLGDELGFEEAHAATSRRESPSRPPPPTA